QQHACGDRVDPGPHRQPRQVAAPRPVDLEKRLLQKIVDPLRIVTAGAQEPPQLPLERGVEPIERVEITALVRRHEGSQRFVIASVAGPAGHATRSVTLFAAAATMVTRLAAVTPSARRGKEHVWSGQTATPEEA